MFTLAIVGRPNVGKSTLFNRLTGSRRAIVHDQPGVTRDRLYGEGKLGDLTFRIIDTAGLEQGGGETLSGRMMRQTNTAIDEADICILLLDARAGLMPDDEHFAQLLRRSGKPVIVAVNKAEGKLMHTAGAEAHALGLGAPITISAEHAEGMGDLLAALEGFRGQRLGVREETSETLLEDDDTLSDPESQGPLHITILGRPNAGKSTLLNALIGQERALTGPEPGLTRDAIRVDWQWRGRDIRLVDTAGLRRKARVEEELEQFSTAETLQALRFAEVAVLVLDATAALEKQDNTLAALVEREGRAMVIALNKWDLVPDKDKYLKFFEERLAEVMAQWRGVPVVPLSAMRGKNLDGLMEAVIAAHGRWNKRVGTGELNRWLEEALQRHNPPLIKGRRIKIRYMTQVKTRPPTFMLATNEITEMPEDYLRYLTTSLRETFDFPGIPLRLRLKKPKNPYQ